VPIKRSSRRWHNNACGGGASHPGTPSQALALTPRPTPPAAATAADYGRRPLDAVLEDVDRWCDAINGYRRSVRGVFIDQVAEDLTCAPKDKVCLKDYYQKVVDAIRSKCSVLGVGDAMIMLNPGRSFNECKFMADNKVGGAGVMNARGPLAARSPVTLGCRPRASASLPSVTSLPRPPQNARRPLHG
jgi:hypothetical protein